MPTSRRFTFTIRDLLALMVVCAFAAMLLPMMLPRIQERSVPPTLDCINNLSQVSKAALVSATRNGNFPGYQNRVNGVRVSWPMSIMRELGRSDIADQVVDTATVARVPIRLLRCPKDRSQDPSFPQLSYVINAGRANDLADKPANGVALDRFSDPQTMTLAYIATHDGTSQTLLFSENLQATTWDVPGKLDSVFLWHDTTTPLPQQRINGGDIHAPLTIDTARPSSNHPGGAVASFCDGHVQFISEDIDYKVYMQLMTPNGHESDMPSAWKDYMIRERDLDW